MGNKKYGVIDILCALLVGVQFLIVMAGVISRYVFHLPLMWTDEVAKFFLIFITFFGGVIAEKEGQNVRFDFLVKRLPVVGQVVVKIFVDLIIIAFYTAIIYYSIQLSIQANFMQAVTVKWIRWSYIYACIPVSFGLLLIMHIRNSIREIRALLNSRKEGG